MELLEGKKGKQVFHEPFFELMDSRKWNDEIASYFQQFNALKDERASVIFFAIAIESELDSLNSKVFKNYKVFEDDQNFTFSIKIKMLKALALIPEDIITCIILVKDIRNKFAHNIDIHNIKDLSSDSKGKKLISKLDSYCNQLDDKLVYSKIESNYISKFKDIAALSIKALRYFQPNMELLRQEIELEEFVERLKLKAENIKKKEEEYFKNNYRNFFKKNADE